MNQKPLLFFSCSQYCRNLPSVHVPAFLLSCASIPSKIPSLPHVVGSWEVVKTSASIQSPTSKWIHLLNLFKIEITTQPSLKGCPSSLPILLFFLEIHFNSQCCPHGASSNLSVTESVFVPRNSSHSDFCLCISTLVSCLCFCLSVSPILGATVFPVKLSALTDLRRVDFQCVHLFSYRMGVMIEWVKNCIVTVLETFLCMKMAIALH